MSGRSTPTSATNAPAPTPVPRASDALSPHEPSLCIPRVFPNIGEKRIRAIFRELGLGEIDHVDIIKRTNERGEEFKRVFIHFKEWAEGYDALRTRLSTEEGYKLKIVYDDPWYWLVSANKGKKHEPGKGGAPQRPRPRIEM